MVEPEWRVSPWDHRQHAFPEFGEVVSQALCDHSARTSALVEGEGRQCMACLLLLGFALADRHGAGVEWAS
jgi:hypothetical protein